MLKYSLILLLLVGCSTSKLIPYEVDFLDGTVHLYMSNYRSGFYQVFHDDGTSHCYKALTYQGEALMVCSPVDLINLMDDYGFTFKETITYSTNEDWYSVWVFTKKATPFRE